MPIRSSSGTCILFGIAIVVFASVASAGKGKEGSEERAINSLHNGTLILMWEVML